MAAVHYVLKHGTYSLGRGGMGFAAGDVLPIEDGEHMAANHPDGVEIRSGKKQASEPREISANYSPPRAPDAVPDALREQVAALVRAEAQRLAVEGDPVKTGGRGRGAKVADEADKAAETSEGM